MKKIYFAGGFLALMVLVGAGCAPAEEEKKSKSTEWPIKIFTIDSTATLEYIKKEGLENAKKIPARAQTLNFTTSEGEYITVITDIEGRADVYLPAGTHTYSVGPCQHQPDNSAQNPDLRTIWIGEDGSHEVWQDLGDLMPIALVCE